MGTSIGVRPTEWKHELESSDGRKNLIAVIIPVGGEDCKYSLSGIQFFSCIWISALMARNPESNILSLLRSAIVPPIVA